jgi:hypothetical protein
MHQVQQCSERGGSRLKLLITLLIVGFLVFMAVKIVPVYVNAYQFQDSMQSEARFALSGYPTKNADTIRNDIWQKAQDLSIPLGSKDDIQVTENQQDVEINVNYSVPVDLKVYQFTLQFHPHADNHTI